MLSNFNNLEYINRVSGYFVWLRRVMVQRIQLERILR